MDNNTPNNKQTIQILTRLLKQALPLIRRVESDEFTRQERAALRMKVGDEDFFELSTMMNRLCSERARQLGRVSPEEGARLRQTPITEWPSSESVSE